MSHIQKLLDAEAHLSNTNGDKKLIRMIHHTIKQLRGSESPVCWGQDDCSTEILMRCPWRIDCGGDEPKN